MPYGVVLRGDVRSAIVRAPKIYGKAEALKVETLHGSSLKEADVLGRKIFIDTWRWNSDVVEMNIARCKEHRCVELVPVTHYLGDMRYWYDVGRHPRFSLLDALRTVGRQGLRDTATILAQIIQREDMRRRTALREALRKCRDPKDFIHRIRPFLRTRIRVGGRQINVTNEFADRFKGRDFTVRDFLNQPNQELRRVIARFVPIPKVVAEMRQVAKDNEGTIYEEMRSIRRYLHVVCPSTKQDYLLEIPRQIRGGDPQRFRDLVSPAEARRWTFDLPVDAEFAKEA